MSSTFPPPDPERGTARPASGEGLGDGRPHSGPSGDGDFGRGNAGAAYGAAEKGAWHASASAAGRSGEQPDDLEVDAVGAEDSAEGPGAADAPWPPRPASVPVDARFAQRELRLDAASEQVAPPPAPDFTPSKLVAKPLPIGRAGVGRERGSVVAYDKRYGIGRSRWTEIFDADDRDYERRRQSLAREGALLGSAALVFVTLSLNPLGLTLLASGGAGAIAGAMAATRSDSVWAWFLALGLAGFVLLPMMNPFLWFIAEGECLLVGWLAGFTREARH